MTIHMLIPYLIVCPLVFLAGYVDAIAGGGGLISLPAYLISGLPAHVAIGTNKLSSSMGTFAATFKYAKNGYICWKRAIPCALLALTGSVLGARSALLLSDRVFKLVMLVILPLTAVYALKSKALQDAQPPLSAGKTMALSLVISTCIGAYDGFYGPGTGTFLLLLLTGLAHIPLTQAAGTTKVINLVSNVTALSIYIVNGKTLFPLGFVAGIFSIVGNCLGARSFTRRGARFVRPLIVVVLLIFLLRVAFELF